MKNNINVDEARKKGLKKDVEEAVLVGVILPKQSEQQITDYLDELEFLARTAGAISKKRYIQKLRHPDSRYYIGKGKLEEIQQYVEDRENITMVIFDDDLTGKQTNLIEQKLKVKIIDRSTLILDIFARRAKTAQAKTQVELAQMQYLLPRLRGLWTHLERQRGGIGMRGPGEQEIETDRRLVRDKIAVLKKRLETIDQQNKTRRKHRGKLIRAALVGYTNVGKSTLMNRLSKSDVFAENKLFATLDTTVRKVVLERTPFLLSDTVGFIRKLPHHLIESFKSTLDEAKESDILIHVVDLAHPQYEDHINTVRNTLLSLEVTDKPTLMIFNKMDLYRAQYFDELLEKEDADHIEEELKRNIQNQYEEDCIFISAKSGENMDILRGKLNDMITQQYEVRYPYESKGW